MDKGFADLIDDIFESPTDRVLAKRWVHISINKPKTLEVTIAEDLKKITSTTGDVSTDVKKDQ